MKNIKKSKGFTLVELLIVIAIIGVLAALIMPNLTSVIRQGDTITAKNNGRSIAQGWMTYTRSGSRHMINAKDVYEWAAVLAEKGDLNNAKIWILGSDLAVQEAKSSGLPEPLTVSNKTGNNWQLNPEFRAYPLSWEVANRTDPNAPSGTPLVWSRGLKSSGTWDETGAFGTSGGVMAFVDARVEFYPSLRDSDSGQGILQVYNGTQRTFNIAQAIRGGSSNILRSDVGILDEIE